MGYAEKKFSVINIFAVFAALISAIFAIYSGCSADSANKYVKEINKAAISLKSTVIEPSRTSPDTLLVTFIFNFKNTGNEDILINNISSSYYNFKDNTFTDLFKNHQIINMIHPDVEFSTHIGINIEILQPLLKTEEIIKVLPKSIEFCTMMRIDYSSSQCIDYDVYYMKYIGDTPIQYLTISDYEKMESALSKAFLLNRDIKHFKR